MPDSRTVQLGAADAPVQSPEHKRFHQLAARIDKARALLAAWEDNVPLFARAHAERVRPLLAELAAARRAWLFELDAVVARPGLSAADRHTVQRTLCDEAAALLDAGDDMVADAALKALHDKHADVDFDTANRHNLLSMQRVFEAASGLDLGDAVLSHDELVERTQAAMAAAAATEAAPPQRAQRPGSKAQARREEEARQATQSVRDVYRKLASGLHPDRAADDAERSAKTALMQRVNQAYAANDLLALLTLQLEMEQVDGRQLGNVPAARVKHYNKVLAEQLQEIESGIAHREMAFAADHGLLPDKRLNPAKLMPLIGAEQSALRFALSVLQHDRKALTTLPGTKRWIKRQRQHQREDDAGFF